ncbi:nucleic acid-binding, OB-fold protein, partial [Tanacetum coccineum]
MPVSDKPLALMASFAEESSGLLTMTVEKPNDISTPTVVAELHVADKVAYQVSQIPGCLTRVGNVREFRSANTNQKVIRKLDIENLNGNVIELALWDDMAPQLQQKRIRFNGKACLQLSASLATHDYLNLDIPDLEEFRTQFAVAKKQQLYKAQQNLNPPLEISKERCQDPIQEKARNRFALSTLLYHNPYSYR